MDPEVKSKIEFYNRGFDTGQSLSDFLAKNDFESAEKLLLKNPDLLEDPELYILFFDSILYARPSKTQEYEKFFIDFISQHETVDISHDLVSKIKSQLKIAFIRGDLEEVDSLIEKIKENNLEKNEAWNIDNLICILQH